MNALDGRRILVVGAGSTPSTDDDPPVSNGRAISVRAAVLGAHVACADRVEESAAETAAWIEREGGRGDVLVGDVSDADTCARLVDQAVQRLGGLDGVVCNVGVGGGTGMQGTTAEVWDLVLNVNLRSHFLVAKAALPVLGDGGSLVFIGSIAGVKPGSRIPAYDASKAALGGLTRHVALEGAHNGVRANLVNPGSSTPCSGGSRRLGGQAAPGRRSRSAARAARGRSPTSCASCCRTPRAT